MTAHPKRGHASAEARLLRLPAAGLPPDAVLRGLVQEGHSFEEIEGHLEQHHGIKLHPAALGVALSRAVLRETTGARYRSCVPWRVRPEHRDEEPVRMLRLLGRRRSGLPLEPTLNARLEAWLHRVRESQTVVGYCPDLSPGFVNLPEAWRGPDEELPLRAWALDLEIMARALAGEAPPVSPGPAIYGR